MNASLRIQTAGLLKQYTLAVQGVPICLASRISNCGHTKMRVHQHVFFNTLVRITVMEMKRVHVLHVCADAKTKMEQ
jgi:hypothetical protein